jgi:hypothetical protein
MKGVVLLLFLIFPLAIIAQSTNASYNEDYYHWVDRYEVKAGRIVPELFTTLKPYKRSAIVAFVDSLNAKDQVFTSSADQFNYAYFRNDNWEWSRSAMNDSKKPFAKKLYRKKSDLLFVDEPDFDLHVNPVLYLGLGKNTESLEIAPFSKDRNLFINTRGVEVRGMVDRKIGFYTFIGENQAILPVYAQKRVLETGVVPHEGFWKGFKDEGVDFFQARGYIDFNVSKHVYMQLGHDKMFVGNGIRSLIYSDYAPPQMYWRTNVKVWKLNYLFQINRMVADVSAGANGPTSGKYPEKYTAFHHASFNIGRRLNIGFFESVVFSPLDPSSGTARNSLELNYFNPLIFYRAIEQQYGSSDNAIVGADFKWNALKGVSFYGQFVLDEFLLSHVRAQDGWWANKFGLQGGIKYIDVLGVSNLDIQVEGNVVRPYTYSHGTSYANYTNYRQPVAHPLGANFKELVGIVRYQPLPRLNLMAKVIHYDKGVDYLANGNWGGDLLKINSTRVQEFDNEIGQGTFVRVNYLDFTASYMLKHNLFADLKLIRRTTRMAPLAPIPSGTTVDNSDAMIASLALRWNIAPRNYDF